MRYTLCSKKLLHFEGRTSKEKEKYEKLEKKAAEKNSIYTSGFKLHCLVVVVLWVITIYIYSLMTLAPDVLQFNPYDVLGIEPGADGKAVKKAYRSMAKLLHPDLNPDDPKAEEKFTVLSKAYKCLTDDVARENWEKYGNPDGPQPMSVSIGLPAIMLDGDFQFITVFVYLCALVFMTPWFVYKWYRNSKKYGGSDIQINTYKYYGALMNQTKNLAELPEVLCAASEFEDLLGGRVFTKDEHKALMKLVKQYGIVISNPPGSGLAAGMKFPRWAMIHSYDILLHLWLMHKDIPEDMFDVESLDIILEKSMRLCEVMIELVGNPKLRYFRCTMNIISFMQRLTQRSWEGEIYLNQLPHHDKDRVNLIRTMNNVPSTILHLLKTKPSDRKIFTGLSEEKLLDINNVLKDMPVIDIAMVRVHVDEEENVYAGDLFSLEITLKRSNLKEGEEAAPVYCPDFPAEKRESWWVIVTSTNSNGFIEQPVAMKKITSQGQIMKVMDLKLFAPPKAQVVSYDIHIRSQDYVGYEMKTRVKVEIRPVTEAPVYEDHPEDLALDKEPTLLEQLYGNTNNDEDSDSDSEDEGVASGGSHGHTGGCCGEKPGASEFDVEEDESHGRSNCESKKTK